MASYRGVIKNAILFLNRGCKQGVDFAHDNVGARFVSARFHMQLVVDFNFWNYRFCVFWMLEFMTVHLVMKQFAK